MTNLQEFQIPIETLFKLMNASNIELDNVMDVTDAQIEIKTPTGWTRVNGLVRKKTIAAKYYIEDQTLICSTNHLVFEKNKCKPISQCGEIDSLNGSMTIDGSELLGEMILYDVALDYPHKYVTSNGIIHHNTTLAKILMKALDVDPSDIKFVNASKNTGIDYIRDLENFIETMPSGKYRYVILDEADRISSNGQDALKSMIEEYSAICRWILTTNRPNKIHPPLHSRMQGFHIEQLDREQFVTRVATILIAEGIDLKEENLEILDEYVSVTYPDLRKCINTLQQNCKNGVLSRPSHVGSGGMTEYMVQAVHLFKSGKIHEARKLICANANDNDFEEIYSLLYKNIEWFGKDEDTQNKAIVIIANRLKDHSLIADPEIGLAATLVELSMLSENH